MLDSAERRLPTHSAIEPATAFAAADMPMSNGEPAPADAFAAYGTALDRVRERIASVCRHDRDPRAAAEPVARLAPPDPRAVETIRRALDASGHLACETGAPPVNLAVRETAEPGRPIGGLVLSRMERQRQNQRHRPGSRRMSFPADELDRLCRLAQAQRLPLAFVQLGGYRAYAINLLRVGEAFLAKPWHAAREDRGVSIPLEDMVTVGTIGLESLRPRVGEPVRSVFTLNPSALREELRPHLPAVPFS